jgi:L-rhamnose-H+ transport protein
MESNPFLGVVLHAIGGLAAASFYIPYKKVRGWSWETYWLAGGFFSWIVAPWVLALLIVPNTVTILKEAQGNDLLWTYLFGVLWGVGGLMFGLSMRYLGISLGYAIALGFCAAFGTLVPPVYSGVFGDAAGQEKLNILLTTMPGWTVLAGVAICLVGIAVSGMAGMAKERELTEEQKKTSIQEFSFVKGLIVAVICGILSASMNYGFAAGEPIANLAVKRGAPVLWQNLPVLVVILAGGFTTNSVWCVLLNIKNRTGRQYLGQSVDGSPAPLVTNYLFSALAGTLWYFQFFFFSMGKTKMGKYDFSSWALHMASIIIFSTFWGLALKEWRGTSDRTRKLIAAGLTVLIVSMSVVGLGAYLEKKGNESKQKPNPSARAPAKESTP